MEANVHAGPVKEFEIKTVVRAKVELKFVKALPHSVALGSPAAEGIQDELSAEIAQFTFRMSELGWNPA